MILYNGNGHNGTSTTDFVSFGLKDGVPEFRFDVGSGPGLVRASQPLSMAGWHTVQLNRVKREGNMIYFKYINHFPANRFPTIVCKKARPKIQICNVFKENLQLLYLWSK